MWKEGSKGALADLETNGSVGATCHHWHTHKDLPGEQQSENPCSFTEQAPSVFE